jgi:hypothetical protein
MLPEARIGAKSEDQSASDTNTLFQELAEVVSDARRRLATMD